MTNLANNLTLYRKKNGLTQGQLGELLHVSAQAISKWENGQAEPGIDIILKLAEIYHISTDELLSSAQAESAETVTAAQQEKKPSGFAKFLRKFWYIPVILLLLIGVAIGVAIGVTSYLNAPARYGDKIANGKIALGMTKSEVKDLLGVPTDSADDETLILFAELGYKNADYYLYYNEREPKNDNELWFGVKYEYLRLVFDKESGELIEAFYNADATEEIWSYGETEHLTVASLETLLAPTKKQPGNGIITFTNGSVYLGEYSHPREGSNNTGTITTDKTKIETALGTFDLIESIKDTAKGGKTCYICGEKKTDCKNDTRVLGEDAPVPVCADCRRELDELLGE